MLLVLNVLYYGKVADHVAREIHRSRGWAGQWLKRYDKEGVDGLKDGPKGERHPKISKNTECKIKTVLKESNYDWTTVHVNTTASVEEKKAFKKKSARYLWVNNYKKKVLPWYLQTNPLFFIILLSEGYG